MDKKMKHHLEEWEKSQLQALENQAENKEHPFSETFEQKMDLFARQDAADQTLSQKKQKRKHWTVYAAACTAAALFIMIIHISDFRSMAAEWLEEYLHLQIHEVDEETNKKTKIDPQDKDSAESDKTQTDSSNTGVEFTTLIDMTEREYWDYLKEQDLSPDKIPSYIPEGYTAVPEKDEYYYTWNEKKEDEFDDTITLSQAFPNTGFYGETTEKPKKNAKQKNMVLRRIKKTWKKGSSELVYYERIYDWTKTIPYSDIEDYEKINVAGNDGYLIKREDGRLCIHLYRDTTLLQISISGEDEEWMYQELVKIAESVD